MNIAILGTIIILISRSGCSFVKNDNALQVKAERGIFLRKLQSSIRSSPEEGVQSLTWSEILADVLVKRILFQKPYVVNETQQIFSSIFEDVTITTTSESSTTYYIDIQLNEAERPKDPKEDFEIITINPDVEIIEPEYHGKLCKGCKEGNNEQNDYKIVKEDCPIGLKRDAKGNCEDPKSSNFILSVPYQCPIGYRADWFGYCRMSF
ncbi:unnamed protein product [Parnassius mnemosyne]|uniref:Uncharacterized protein n=1 Tax=Parnassius mnemosyne TaxID=213953 RepID=A0AAV1KAW1_9NEOP